MVHHIPKKPLYLLAALPSAVLAGKDAPVTKDFKFTEDVHIKFDPLNTAIGPEQKDLLLDSLNGPFAEEFKTAWIAQIEANLQDGGCTVNAMTLPKFSICNWRYPDLYNVDELPLPGQCYEYENGFIQRVYYKIKRLEITCPDNFKYKDLDQDSYVEAAFANNAFLDIIQPTNSEGVVPFEEDCDVSLDEKPLVTSGTCGGGDRGDGECPTEGYCCSQWGYCGTTDEYCSSDVAPTPSSVEGAPQAPTIQIDAGTCGSGGGDSGDGFCPLDNAPCCSNYGYCGTGEQYCFVTKSIDVDSESDNGGTCGGGGVGNGLCKDETLCCSQFGFCGTGDLYCTGVNSDIVDDVDESVVERSPLPDSLQPEFGFRCGVTEVDARSNCKSQCTHHIQCADGEECWGVQLNYCNTFEEGEHPICTDLDLADNDSRCGFDEASARGYCGNKCGSDDECGDGEYCFPTLLNLCECHLDGTKPEESEENTIVFSQAKALISPYFVQSEPMGSTNSNVEGKPRNGSSVKSTLSALSVLLIVGVMVL